MLRAVTEATYERLAALLEPVEEELVGKLAPKYGERWLDLVTGTGAIALGAARAGAVVTAVDNNLAAKGVLSVSVSQTVAAQIAAMANADR